MTTKNWPWSTEGALSKCELVDTTALEQFGNTVTPHGTVTQILSKIDRPVVFVMTTSLTVRKEDGGQWNDRLNSLKYFQDAGRSSRRLVIIPEGIEDINSFSFQTLPWDRSIPWDKQGDYLSELGKKLGLGEVFKRGTLSEVSAVLLAMRNMGHRMNVFLRFITESTSVGIGTTGECLFAHMVPGKSRQELTFSHELSSSLASAKNLTLIPMIVLDL